MPLSPIRRKHWNSSKGLDNALVPFSPIAIYLYFYLRQNLEVCYISTFFFLVLTRYVVTVSVYWTFYFLFTSIRPPLTSFLLLLLVLWCCWKKDRREHSVWHTSCFVLFFLTETANQMSKILLQFLCWISMLLLYPSILADIKCKVMCWSFCKYVQMWKYKLLRKKMYI